MEGEGGAFVRKIAGAVIRNDRLRAQATKQREAGLHGVAVPTVLRFHAQGELFAFDMQYVAASSIAHRITTADGVADDLIRMLVEQVAQQQPRTAVHSLSPSVFSDKISDVIAASRICVLTAGDRSRLDAIGSALLERDWSGVPEGWCHGDLTFDNILMSADGTHTLIDFDAPFAASPWLDYTKLLQDVVGHWCVRTIPATSTARLTALERLDRMRPIAFASIRSVAPALVNRVGQFVALHLLRTIPYAKSDAASRFALRQAIDVLRTH
jgi:hypothetical protein